MAPDCALVSALPLSASVIASGIDLARRAAAAGVKALVLTIDTPTRTVRPRETKSGIVNPFKLTNRLRLDALTSPHWLASMHAHRHSALRFRLTTY